MKVEETFPSKLHMRNQCWRDQLLAYFQTKESFCYVMEYCEGGTLHSLMSRLQLFHEDLARFYATQIILAVNFLHY
jgi:serine/threonine protein kinase